MRGVAIQADERVHHIDHMGPLSIYANIPYLFSDEKEYLHAKKYYPGINASFVTWEGVHPSVIQKEYDTLFLSFCIPREEFEILYSPRMQNIFWSHGNSDKGYNSDVLKCFQEADHVLMYGQRMIDFLKERDVFHGIRGYSVVGNIRYDYYLKHKAFYDVIVEQEIFSYFKDRRKRILYAPTWCPGEGTMMEAEKALLTNIPEEFQLIIKLHPFFVDNHLAYVENLIARFENHPQVLIIREYSLIYPLLSGCDLYIGDISSVGYDFLAFNRPMFFLNKNNVKNLFLYQTGTVLPFENLYTEIKKALLHDHELFSSIREKVYHYTFQSPSIC